MQALQEYGVEVYSVRGRGYRLPEGLDLLSVAKIKELLGDRVEKNLKHIELKTFTDSTNLMALRNIQEHNHGALYLAEYQSAGRGRRGRTLAGAGSDQFILLFNVEFFRRGCRDRRSEFDGRFGYCAGLVQRWVFRA